MPRRARIQYTSLRSSLVNLPLSLYAGLVQGNVRPQGLGVHLKPIKPVSGTHKDGVLLGWTGLASSSSLAASSRTSGPSSDVKETVALDPQLGQSLGTGFAEGDIVEVGLIHDLTIAKTVNTEPVSEDDWEILELHAEYVETNLLGQVRCAYVGQEICVWVLGRTLIRMRVVSSEPDNSSGVLLVTDTEVVIAPRKRMRTQSDKESTGITPAQGAERSSGNRTFVLRALPPELFRAQLSVDLPYQHLNGSLSEEGNSNSDPPTSVLAFTSLQSFVEMTTAKAESPQWSRNTKLIAAIAIKRIEPPRKEADDSRKVRETESRVLHRAGAENLSTAPQQSSVIEAFLMPSSALPDRDIVILYPPERGSEIKNWDLVQCDFVPARQPLATQERFYRLLRQTESFTYEPAGISQLIDKMAAYLRRSLYLSMGLVNGLGRMDTFGSALIHGRKGYGKTLVSRAIAERLSHQKDWFCRPVYIDMDSQEYTRLSPLQLKARILDIIDEAAWNKPSTLIFDNLDAICPPEDEHQPSQQIRQKAALLTSLLAPTREHALRNTAANGILLIATADSVESLHPLFMKKHVFGQAVDLSQCNIDTRKAILEHYVEARTAKGFVTHSHDDPINYNGLAGSTEGYSPMDLIDLIERGVHTAAMRQGGKDILELCMQDLLSAQQGFVPLALRDVPLTKSNVAWGDIGGLGDVKRVLRETLEWPTKYAAIFQRAPLRLRSGLLLYGYPGCGKTLLASAVAKECGLHFITIKGPELLNKYIGASEQSVRDLFARASAAKPCVLFFDEFDSIAPRRGHDSTGVTDRVVNQLLTQMDGAEGLEGVYVLAATSRPDLIDPALLRPGRLDKSLLCDMPNLADRKEILVALSSKVPVEDPYDLEEIAQMTEGYSGADLQAVLYNAHLAGIHDFIEEEKAKLEKGKSANLSKGSSEASQFIEYGGQVNSAPMSLADREAFQKRVTAIMEAPNRMKEESSMKSNATKERREKRKITKNQLFKSLQSTRPSVPPEEMFRLRAIYQGFLAGREGKLQRPSEENRVGMRVSMA